MMVVAVVAAAGLFLVVLGIGVAVVLLGRAGRLRVKGRAGYASRIYLFSRAEASFYGVLRQAVGNDFVIMGKVRLADVVEVEGGRRRHGASAWQSAFNRVNAKHVDFLLLDGRDLKIRVALELDDSSHGRADRRVRDALVEEVLMEAGVPLVRVRAAAGYNVGEVRRRVMEAAGGIVGGDVTVRG
jgi:hypothetical protein